ncbi:MAG TPA: hypothetical protein VMB51_13555 [Solirubrobacteraceae bacterium]|nr:hypothetical protein [Solirubrobacteraceae bacterium]
MLRRWGTRLAFSLVGIAAGLLLCTAALSSFSVSAAALVEATLLFWLVHIVVQFLALKVLIRQPSVALAGLLALASTIIALLIVNAIVSGMHIGGPETYVPATLIIWACTAVADALGTRRIRDERADRRAERRDR